MATFNLTADGSTPASRHPRSTTIGPLSEVLVIVTGTFGGGNVALEMSVDGTNWAPVDLPLSDVGTALFKTHRTVEYRATLAGATAPNIDVTFLP